MPRSKTEIPESAVGFLGRRGTSPDSIEELRLSLRKRAKEDFWWFCRYVIGYPDIDTELHHDMCARWEARRHLPYSLWLVPRKHLKTSIWTVADCLYEAVLNPNQRQLIVSAKLSLAIDMLREMKLVVAANEMFRWLFPDYCIDLASKRKQSMCKWVEDRVDWPCKTLWKKEGSLEVMAVEATLVSKHFDIIRYDDIHNELNVTHKEYRDKIHSWFLNSWQLRHKPNESRLRILGTRWHYDDTYGREMQKEVYYREQQQLEGKKVKPNLITYLRSVKQGGHPIWPERFNDDVLAHLRHQLGSYIFSCQYENNPISPEESIFRRENLHRVNEDDLRGMSLNNFAAVDLAYGEKEHNDFTVVTVASFDVEGKMYVREIFRDRIFPDELIEVIMNLAKRWNLLRVGVETQGFQKVILKDYKKKSLAAGVYVPWTEIKRSGHKSKLQRFYSLQPLVERGDFHVVSGIPNISWMEEEMTTLTAAHLPANDDILDTLVDVYQLSFEAPPPEEPELPADSAEAVFSRGIGSLTARDDDSVQTFVPIGSDFGDLY